MKKKIEVTNPKGFNTVFYVLFALIAIVMVINSIANGFEIAMILWFTPLVIIPTIIAFIWWNMFKVTVDGNTITVRRGIGTKYTFDVSEIQQVTWKIVRNKFTMGQKPDTLSPTGKAIYNDTSPFYADGQGNRNVVIRTKNKRFAVSNVQDGFGKMSKYLKENVDSSKIKVEEINMK